MNPLDFLNINQMKSTNTEISLTFYVQFLHDCIQIKISAELTNKVLYTYTSAMLIVCLVHNSVSSILSS